MKNNRIPRKFNRITAISKIDLSSGKAGNIYHIYKDDFGYIALNTFTGKYFYLPVATLRNENVFDILNIE